MRIGKGSHRAQAEDAQGVNQLSTHHAKSDANAAATMNGDSRAYRDRVEVNIERLILDGFNYSDQYQIAIVIEKELARLFSEKGTPSLLETSQEISRLRSPTVELTSTSKTVPIGKAVARQLFSGLGR
jgi:hypothetical protein